MKRNMDKNTSLTSERESEAQSVFGVHTRTCPVPVAWLFVPGAWGRV